MVCMKKPEKEYTLLVRNTLMHFAYKRMDLTKSQVADVFSVDKSTAGRVLEKGVPVTRKKLTALRKAVR
jgi:hypothetical protein